MAGARSRKNDSVLETLCIERPEQLAALTSPVRLELLELIGISGPCAVSDVALRMSRAPDSLYYHVRLLLRVGLLEHVGDRRAGQRKEALYRVPAKQLVMPRKSDGPLVRENTHKAVDSILRLAARELKVALEDESAEDEGPERTLYGRRMRARLTKRALRELNRHLSAVEELFARAALAPPRRKGSRGAEGTVAVTVTMTPVPGRRRD